MKIPSLLFIGAAIGSLFTLVQSAAGQGTAFSYQGLLVSNGAPSSGQFDLVFTLYNDPQIGSQQGPAVTNYAVQVSNGLFTTYVDFGAAPWTGQALWMQLLVEPAGSGPFTSLSPREPISSTPYAIQAAVATSAQTAANATLAATATTATTASTALTATTAANFSGSLSGDVTGTMNNTTVAYVAGVPAATVINGANLASSLLNTAGNQNTFVGQSAGMNGQLGAQNTGLGNGALFEETGGYKNTASGFQALFYNTNGSDNTATGAAALYQNENGNANTAMGTSALSSSLTGNANTALGNDAMGDANGGSLNTATGAYSLIQIQNSTNNTADGAYALQDLETGSNNLADGANALSTLSVGNNNTAVGAQALGENFTGSDNIALGYLAGSALVGFSNIDIGNPGQQSDNNTIRIGTPGVQTATYLAGVLNGDGGGLTNLNATELSGTVPLAQLPAALITNESTAPVVFNGNVSVSNLTVDGSLTVSNSPGINFDETPADGLDNTPIPAVPGFVLVSSVTNSTPGPGYFLITGWVVVTGIGDGDDIDIRVYSLANNQPIAEAIETGASTSTFSGEPPFNTLTVTTVVPVTNPGQKQVFQFTLDSSSSSGTIYYHTFSVLYIPRLNN